MDIPSKKICRRGENWAQEEKDLFLKIMRMSAPIVDSKLTDPNSTKRKISEWEYIQNKLKEFTGKPRDIEQLKGFWRRTKMGSKKTSKLRRALQGDSNGERSPPPSPFQNVKVLEYCATDLSVDENGLYCAAYQTVDENNVDSESFPQSEETVVKPNRKTNAHQKAVIENNIDSESLRQSEAAVVELNRKMKERQRALMEEEYSLKLMFQRQLIAHQKQKQELEVELLHLEKQKKLLEIEQIKKTL